MTKFRKAHILSVLLIAIGCTNKTPNPVSYVDSYSPHLLDVAGTVYQGNYFPLTAGLFWNSSGNKIENDNTHSRIHGGGFSIDTIYKDSIFSNITSIQVAESLKTIPVSGINYPITQMKQVEVAVSNVMVDSSIMTPFYQTTDSAIIIKAIVSPNDSGNDTIPCGNTILLKLPLVAGNKWESTPLFALNDVGPSARSYLGNLNMRSVTYVLGKDTVMINGVLRETIHLDEVFEISLSTSDSGITVTASSQGISSIYLAKDTGEIKETQNQTITMHLIFGQDTSSVTETDDEVEQISSSTELTSFQKGLVLAKRIIHPLMTSSVSSSRINEHALAKIARMKQKTILRLAGLSRAFLY